MWIEIKAFVPGARDEGARKAILREIQILFAMKGDDEAYSTQTYSFKTQRFVFTAYRLNNSVLGKVQ